ncbi:restriction endonuclease subunit S [bacterium]|nr:restriction endonuclease subunit S [bacterium]
MEIPKTQKQTDIGLIPEDWHLHELGSLASVAAGGTPSRGNPSFWDGEIPWITTTQVDWNIIKKAEQFITKLGLLSSASSMLPAGTLIMALYGQGKTRGKVAILGINATTNQACAAISIKGEISKRFVFHFLVSRYEEIRGMSNSGSQENLNGQIVKSIQIPLPPKAEQEAIAEALSDADALIESLEQLIAKKRQIKQGAMQELLTGKTRLPGFEGEWETKPLESVGRFRKGRNIPKSVVTTSGMPCVLYGEIYTRYDNVASELHSFIPQEVSSQSEAIENGDILFAGSGETVEEIGKCFAYTGDQTAYAGGDLIILTPHEGNSEFLGYVLNSPPVASQKAKLGQGSTVAHIYTSSLKTIELELPTPDEQDAIASVLSGMTAELEALESKLSKYRQIKQGMMHNLLTGKIRLI